MTASVAQPDGSGPLSDAFPVLTTQQRERLAAYGDVEPVRAGQVLFRAGDPAHDLMLVQSGVVALLRAETSLGPEEAVIEHGAGRFVGELNLLTGQAAYLTCRVGEDGRIVRIRDAAFRRLIAEDPELSEVVLKALLARRELLRDGPAARTVQIVGSGLSAATLALRTYAARQRLPHSWLDSDDQGGRALMDAAALTPADLPAVVTAAGLLRAATPSQLADELHLTYSRSNAEVMDVVVVGGGPAGLSAAVYAASEGLRTLLIDAVAMGGQAAASSRIENYLGFPAGLSGHELTGRAAVQAMKFGARLASPCQAVSLDTAHEQLTVMLADGTAAQARAVIIATGARYRTLPIPRWSDFEGAGIYYAATELEALACQGKPVVVVGGANSAGQAALHLASRDCQVTVVVRGADLRAGMSAYLAERLLADDRISVRTQAEVTGLHGQASLSAVTVHTRGGAAARQPCNGLFCFIGARPATGWVEGLAKDDAGFLLTDVELAADDLAETWRDLGRPPLPFETSMPSVFAVGDVRRGSMKRVAAAVGEGASAVRSVHTAVGIGA